MREKFIEEILSDHSNTDRYLTYSDYLSSIGMCDLADFYKFIGQKKKFPLIIENLIIWLVGEHCQDNQSSLPRAILGDCEYVINVPDYKDYEEDFVDGFWLKRKGVVLDEMQNSIKNPKLQYYEIDKELLFPTSLDDYFSNNNKDKELLISTFFDRHYIPFFRIADEKYQKTINLINKNKIPYCSFSDKSTDGRLQCKTIFFDIQHKRKESLVDIILSLEGVFNRESNNYEDIFYLPPSDYGGIDTESIFYLPGEGFEITTLESNMALGSNSFKMFIDEFKNHWEQLRKFKNLS